MNTLLILDKDSKTELCEDLRIRICRKLRDKGHSVETVELEKNKVAPCLGLDCFHCVTKQPRECISKDAVYPIKKNIRNYNLAVFLTPVLFGHFSSCIKNALDRGAGSHKLEVIIGYGIDIDDEEKNTFIDLTAKHRGSKDIVHPGMDAQVDVYFTKSIADNAAICESLMRACS